MIPIVLLIFALIFASIHLLYSREWKRALEIYLSSLIFFNIGIMGFISFFAHTYMADETAQFIGWKSGSPFQHEIASANLAFGILGILSLKFRGLFWTATILGSVIFLLGAFVVHLIEYSHGDTAPLNIGIFVWVGDFLLPFLYLVMLFFYIRSYKS